MASKPTSKRELWQKNELWNSVEGYYPREAFKGKSYKCFVAGYNEFGDLAYDVASCNLGTSPKVWDSDLYVTHWIEVFPPNITD